MKVRELMGRQPLLTVSSDERVGVAARMMAWANVRHLPVLREGALVGVLSERDVLRWEARGGHEWETDLVERAMSAPPQTADPDEDVAQAEMQLVSRKIGCLPVVEKGRVIGIVTAIDFLNAHAGELGPAPVPAGWDAKSVMTANPVAAMPNDSLLSAILLMATRNVRHLPVVDEEHRVVGMLSDRDVRARIGNPVRAAGTDTVALELLPLRVKDAMTAPARTVAAGTPLLVLVDRLSDERVGALPVVDDDGRLVGMISYLDVMKVLRTLA